ncbi:MAG TPA: TonB-dependent receptor plug domain-containing protein, partial [Steroidobacteraceae bacterium]|nr:TonB-dependent receptor plug domain-containing protein [Steroidobacteraceae bacterium]
MSKVFAALSASVVLISTANADSQQDASQLDEVTVLGSRIPRTSAQGPTPVVVVDDAAIRANGFTSVADVLGTLSQNGGEVQSQQSFSSGDFTPGAQAVDLRGLGPNHTLVLVNGRRIADFPLPYKGKSNFTDISNIPLSMIDKIEVLSGSASAIYGSDAISGVVNFQLKKAIDGTTFDVRLSNTELGGGASQRFALITGWTRNNFNLALGMEFLNQEPLWAWNRSIQDSTADGPTADSQSPRRTFLRFDPDGNYLDPGVSTCNSLAHLNNHSTVYATRPEYGPLDVDGNNTDGHYCGSAKSISYGTMVNGRRGLNVSASLTADISDRTQFFTDILYGYSKVRLFTDVLDWQFEDANGSEDGYFINSQIGDYDNWYRQFTPEEMGGFARNMITNVQTTLSITSGLKGDIGDQVNNKGWSYETYFSHSEYKSTTSWPRVIRQKANDLFLGPQQGTDVDSGYPVFDADPARLYTPLTRSEYDSITTRTTYHPATSNDSISLVLRTPALFSLPAGDVGFAAVAEAG